MLGWPCSRCWGIGSPWGSVRVAATALGGISGSSALRFMLAQPDSRRVAAINTIPDDVGRWRQDVFIDTPAAVFVKRIMRLPCNVTG